MRNRTYAVWLGVTLATLCLRAASALACMGTTVLLQDDFKIMEANWGQPSAEISVRNGHLIIKPTLNGEADALNNGNVFTDMDACVNVTLSAAGSQMQHSYGGMMFWVADASNYYEFMVSGPGTFAVYRHLANRWITVVPWTQNAAFKKGLNQANQIRVVTKGNQATLYANGTQVTAFSGQPPAGGGEIGLSGASGAKTQSVWQFSDLKITNPS